MANKIEQLAEQHGMTVEFVAWFFSEKKAGCGNAWFMMMAAMWEGWKGREAESAALATIEKCREVSGCPAGVDLQDHLRQLAAENVGLKKFIQTECFVGHIDPETFYEEEVTRYVNANGYEPETPATDAYMAGIKADGVEEFAAYCGEENSVFVEAKAYYRSLPDAAYEFCVMLREGAK